MYTLDDFRKEIRQVLQPSLLQSLLSMLPGMGHLHRAKANEQTRWELSHYLGVIDSMTPAERSDPKAITPVRRQRIAKGAGVQTAKVDELIQTFETMGPMLERIVKR